MQTLVGKIGLDATVCKVLGRVIDADADASVRLEAVRALAERCAGDASVRRQLVERARNDGHADVRGAAVAVLAQHALGHPEVAELLVERVRDETDGAVFAAAAAAAAASEVSGIVAARARSDANPRVREAAVRALVAKYGAESPVRDALLERVRDDLDARVVAEAAVALVTATRPDVEQRDALLRRARDDDPTVREAVARALGEWFGADAAVRVGAGGAGRERRGPTGAPRGVAGAGRAAGGHPEVRDLLVDRVRDGDWSVREAAVRFLCQHYGGDHGGARAAGGARPRRPGPQLPAAGGAGAELATRTPTSASCPTSTTERR